MAEVVQNHKKAAKVENNHRLQWLRDRGFIKTAEDRNEKGQVVGSKEVVLFKGLLALAHEDEIKRLVTQLVVAPTEENQHTAIFMAEAETKKGLFRCHGDANPDNVDGPFAPHFISVGDTRSKARVLRDALNIELVCAEELGLFEAGSNGVLVRRAANGNRKTLPKEKTNGRPKALPAPAATPAPVSRNGNGPKASPKPKVHAPARPAVPARSAGDEEPMTEKQRNFLFRLASDRGHSGEAAHAYLKETFGVDSLKKVSKEEAKQVIDQWLKEARGEREEALPY